MSTQMKKTSNGMRIQVMSLQSIKKEQVFEDVYSFLESLDWSE